MDNMERNTDVNIDDELNQIFNKKFVEKEDNEFDESPIGRKFMDIKIHSFMDELEKSLDGSLEAIFNG